MNEAFFEYINVLLQDNFFVKVYVVFSELHCLGDIKIQEYSQILFYTISLYVRFLFCKGYMFYNESFINVENNIINIQNVHI